MDFNYFIIGLNHKSADLSLRERVSIPENKILQAQHQLKTFWILLRLSRSFYLRVTVRNFIFMVIIYQTYLIKH